MRLNALRNLRRAAAREEGFTMLFALLALFVSSLLVAAALTSANGDIRLSRKTTAQNKAYYAAVAGVNRYQYELSSNPNYWIECPSLPKTGSPIKVPETTDEEFTVKTLSSTSHSACTANSTTNKQTSILETTGTASGTFRILSTGTSNGTTRSIVATFTHPGFLNYVYLSNYEILDPTAQNPVPTHCEEYYAQRVIDGVTGECGTIVWAQKDKVNGPMHTNDAAAMCAVGTNKPTFGRAGHSPPDKIEINGGHYDGGSGCNDEVTFNGTYLTGGPTLLPPETDNELLESAGYKFSGKTTIVLKSGTPNTMTVTESKGTTTKVFPTSGVIFVENSASTGCSKYTPYGSNYTTDTGCGNVYVSGTYTESLTIAAANDVIVNGNLTTTTETGGRPTGAATLGLIATNFVRVYHPVETTYPVANYVPKTAAASSGTCSATSTVQISGSIKSTSKEVTGLSSTDELRVGDTVTGLGIPASTKITAINKNKTAITLNNTPSSTKTSELTFTLPYEYFGVIKLCVEVPKVGYTFHESEKLDAEACNEFGGHEEAYVSGGKCSYTNTASGCDAPNAPTALTAPVIDAAILSTAHSFINDNFECGDNLGELTVWGSISQFWRGTVGRGEAGYIKNYNYDDRLASQQPPSFLSPSTTSWKLSRETAPPTGFTG
jgi:Tfp pilus assembly protein PilX